MGCQAAFRGWRMSRLEIEGAIVGRPCRIVNAAGRAETHVNRRIALAPIATHNSHHRVAATSHKIASDRRRPTVARPQPQPFRFGLKSLMIVLAVAGVASAVAR